MKFCLSKRIKKEIIFIALMIGLSGCSNSSEGVSEGVKKPLQESAAESQEAVRHSAEDRNSRIPLKDQWKPGDRDYDLEDTIYFKTYYDDSVRGYQMRFQCPEINLQENIEDYFVMDQDDFDVLKKLSEMFYDNRTIEMEEEELEDLFREYGYGIRFQSAVMDDLQVRFIEIKELDGPSLYLSHILMQTWDDEHIYLQDITGPTARTIRSLITITDREDPMLIVHSSGFSEDFVAEEELSFWTYRGTYWILSPLDLTIDSSHAHSAGGMYGDLNRDDLFEPVYYRDGIVYRTSMQGDGLSEYAHRLGIMEEVEKNKSFRLIGINDFIGKTQVEEDCYLQYEINPAD